MIARGQVLWVDFGTERPGRPARRRPGLVVQSDAINDTPWLSTILLPVTSSTRRASLPGFVFVPASASGLSRDSVVVASQPFVVAKSEVESEQVIGELPEYLMHDVDDALRVVFAL